MVHLVTDRTATLAFDPSRIGPFSVPREWTERAGRALCACLLVGREPLAAGMTADAYLERHAVGMAHQLGIGGEPGG
jgi:hypothetical protein